MIQRTTSIDYQVAAEQNLRMLMNNTEAPMWLVDADFQIVECNFAFKDWVQCFIGYPLGCGDNILNDGKNRKYLQKFEMCYHMALKGNSFKTVEDIVVGEETRYTAVTFNPVYDIHNEVTCVSCFAADITEQRKHLHKIEKQNNALRDIAFMESHKLRGPLANIIGLQDLFNYNDPADPVNRDLMEGIRIMSYELDRIVREVVQKTNEV